MKHHLCYIFVLVVLVLVGHSEATMKKFYAMATDEDFAEAAKAGLENQVPHAHDHAKPTVSDGLGQPRTDRSIGETF